MDYGLGFISLLIGYLAGSINFARITTRLFAPEVDLDAFTIKMDDGEKNEYLGGFGAGAARMVIGSKMGIVTALLDILKVVVPMLTIKLLYPNSPKYLIAGFGGLLGHVWPIYYRFKGGRGMSIMLGSFLVMDWAGVFWMMFLGFFLGFVFIGFPMLAYILWMWLMIPWAIWRLDTPEVIFAVVINLSFLIASIPEIKTMQRLKREGKYEAYSERVYGSSAPLGFMKKMTDRFWIFRPVFDRLKRK